MESIRYVGRSGGGPTIVIPSFFQPVAVDIIAKWDVIAGAIAGSGQNGLLIGRTDVVFERILAILRKFVFGRFWRG